MTNGDRIREMSNSDLAEIIMCPYSIEPETCNEERNCLECCGEWLEREEGYIRDNATGNKVQEIIKAGGIAEVEGLMKYRCIKELCITKCDGNGFGIPNEYGYVEVGSEWQQDVGTSITGAEIHLDRINGEGDFTWIETSREELAEAFEAIEV